LAFNGPLMIGPALAGIVIGEIGIHVAFFANAFLTVAVILALILMRPAPPSSSSREPILSQIAEGVRFVASHPVLRWIVLMLLITALTVRPFNSLLAAYSAHILHVDAKAYGWLLAAGGIGTVSGAVITALSRSERRGNLWFVAGIVSALGLCGLAFTHTLPLALVLQVVLGLGTMVFVSSSNVLMQTLSTDEVRGRSMSVYSMILLGLVPAGTLFMGALGSAFGLAFAFVLGGAIAFVSGIWVWFAHPSVRRA
jgi:predicted MFS family arabinose efflux permease